MYTKLNDDRLALPNKQQFAIPYVCTVVLLGVVTLFICASVFLAVIPTKITAKEATLPSEAIRSQTITISVLAAPNPTISSELRKGISDGIPDYTAVEFEAGTEQRLADTLLSSLATPQIRAVNITNSTFDFLTNLPKDILFGLPKEKDPENAIVLTLELHFVFHDDCLTRCIEVIAPNIQDKLYHLPTATFESTKSRMRRDAASSIYSPITYSRILHVSQIRSARAATIPDSSSPSNPLATVTFNNDPVVLLDVGATVSEEPTEPPTEAPTQPATAAPTQPATAAPTQPATATTTRPRASTASSCLSINGKTMILIAVALVRFFLF